MKPLRPSTSWLEASRELINDDNLSVADDVFFINTKKRLRANCCFEVMHVLHSFFSVDIFHTQKLFRFINTFVSNLHRF